MHLTSSFWHCHPWQSHYRTRHKSKALPLQLFTSELLDQLPKLKTVTQQLRLWTTRNLQTQVQTWLKMPEEQVEGKNCKFGHWICMILLVVLQVYTIAVLYSFILLILFGTRKHCQTHRSLTPSPVPSDLWACAQHSQGPLMQQGRSKDVKSRASSSCHGAVWKHVVSVFTQHLLACERPDAECSWSPKASRWNLSLNFEQNGTHGDSKLVGLLPWWFTSSKRSYVKCLRLVKSRGWGTGWKLNKMEISEFADLVRQHAWWAQTPGQERVCEPKVAKRHTQLSPWRDSPINFTK